MKHPYRVLYLDYLSFLVLARCGGEGGIRTLETFYSLPPFQGGALGHYATSPN